MMTGFSEIGPVAASRRSQVKDTVKPPTEVGRARPPRPAGKLGLDFI